MGEPRKQVAVVLAGAVAKGAFEAGALAELVRMPVDIRSIVAASSGALNGTLLASAVHGAPSDDALEKEVDDLCTLWIKKGGASRAFNFNGREFFGLRGASDQRDLLKLLSKNVKNRPHAAPRPAVALTVVVAPLAGVDLPEGTTFEHPCRFTNKDFQDEASLVRVFEAAVASSSFPGAFAPRTVTGVGDCVDGGTVNNTPIKYALEGNNVDTVVLIAPTPAHSLMTHADVENLRGLGLTARLADMLINERLHRDLHEADKVNTALSALENDAALRPFIDQIKTHLGWTGRREIRIVCIRPLEELEGNSFAGFFKKSLRKKYVEAGRSRAREVLASFAAAEP